MRTSTQVAVNKLYCCQVDVPLRGDALHNALETVMAHEQLCLAWAIKHEVAVRIYEGLQLLLHTQVGVYNNVLFTCRGEVFEMVLAIVFWEGPAL